jgi:hypothetical protein
MLLKENDWNDVGVEIDRIIAGSVKPFDTDTIAKDFLAFLRGRCVIPVVSMGYWSTILLDWELTASGPLQIEVFGDRLEVYHFKLTFDVWNEAHKAGQPFSARFVAELPSAV